MQNILLWIEFICAFNAIMITIGIYSFVISLSSSRSCSLPYAHFVQCIQITFYWCDFPPVLTLIFISSHTDFYILRISTLAETSCFHVKFNPRQMHCCVSWTNVRAGEWVTDGRPAGSVSPCCSSQRFICEHISIYHGNHLNFQHHTVPHPNALHRTTNHPPT